MVLAGAIVTPDGGVIYKGTYVHDDIRFVNRDWRQYRQASKSGFCGLEGDRCYLMPGWENALELPGDYVLLSTYIHQVGHFMHDTMPQVYAVDDYKKRFSVDYPNLLYNAIVPYSQGPVYEIYNTVFRPGNRMQIQSGMYIKPERLVVIRSPFSDEGKSVSVEANSYVKRKVDQLYADHVRKEPKLRLYISRGDAKNIDIRSNVQNLKEVHELLFSYGFLTVNLANMAWEDQLDLFTRAQAICGIHGAGLMNAIFMPAGGTVIEVQHPNAWYSIGMSTLLYGLNYFSCPSVRVSDGGKVGMVVDLSVLERQLKALTQ